MRIARAIVAAGWVAVAFSSADREMSRCWEFEVDGPRVLRAPAPALAPSAARAQRNRGIVITNSKRDGLRSL